MPAGLGSWARGGPATTLELRGSERGGSGDEGRGRRVRTGAGRPAGGGGTRREQVVRPEGGGGELEGPRGGEQARPRDRKTGDGLAELLSVKPESVRVYLCSTANLQKLCSYW